ncbi:MAG: hypothetical protein ACR2OZ_09355 [Verrucomicrobiales bacterium]
MHPLSKRVLTVSLENNKVILTYQLGMADGITIYGRRGQEAEFYPLAEDDPAPFVDDRPKLNPDEPETRRYRAVLLYSDEENRQLSEEVTVVVP